ncbi:Periostin [Sarcoptes scabiei]|uniref:Periostin n=1 Tax=Sarcoptes scabiei TaxID=52283 RepID=A0A834R4N7_SARSC|nr:Periostin [Sarcoptes scabiei]
MSSICFDRIKMTESSKIKFITMFEELHWILLICFFIEFHFVSCQSSLSSSASMTSHPLNHARVSNYQPVSDSLSSPSSPSTSIDSIDDQNITNGWTPLIANRNTNNVNQGPSSSPSASSYSAINPSITQEISTEGSTTTTKVIPLVASVDLKPSSLLNVTSHYIASESIARTSFRKPQNTYMIQPIKYQQAFSSSSTPSSKSNPNRFQNKISSNQEDNKSDRNQNHHRQLYHQRHQQQPQQSSKSTFESNKNNLKSNKIINSEVMPIPMIRPHRHGATLGFNLPDQGLTLYLDINELATKPMAQNIGLKVVSHNSNDSNDIINNNKNNGNKINARLKSEKLIDSRQSLKNQTTSSVSKVTIKTNGSIKSEFIAKNSLNENGNHRQQHIHKLNEKSSKKNSSKKTKSKQQESTLNQAKFTANRRGPSNDESSLIDGKVKNSFLSSSRPLSQSNQEKNLKEEISGADKNKRFSQNNVVNHTIFDIPPTASRIPPSFTTQTKSFEQELNFDRNNIIQIKKNFPYSEQDDLEREDNFPKDNDSHLLDDDGDVESENNGLPTGSNRNINDADNNGEEDDEDLGAINDLIAKTTTEIPLEITTITMQPHHKMTRKESTTQALSVEEQIRRQEMIDNDLVRQMQSLLEKSSKLIDLSANTCSAIERKCSRLQCATITNSLIDNSSTTIQEIAQQLNADLVFSELANKFERDIQDLMDFSSNGYTIILPSNDVIRRLPPNLLKQLRPNMENPYWNAYLIDGTHTIESLVLKGSILTRNRKRLFINKSINQAYNINGQRVIYANQRSSNNGLVHVVDGLFLPSSELDIMNTLKYCGRFDGFVTLAEGTGFAEVLKKDGPFTVFVPSNDALQKVPDNDLEIIRRNMTALKEFLMYHVAEGVHYSQDYKMGNF